jgi:undecaprenyl-diphosphatase
MSKAPLSLRRIESFDLALCLRLNGISRNGFWRGLFRIVSRLGNGTFWYGLMLALVLNHGLDALPTVGRMLLAAALGLAIYKWLKATTSRPRPYQVYQAITAAAPALDRFSFPSGHTLHAISFSLVACHGYPFLAWVVWPFALLVAFSRPVLGLHYPSDVLVGAGLGAVVAMLVLAL